MPAVITLPGIDQAISNLNYKSTTALKYRLISTIRAFYENEASVETLQEIDADELIIALWDTGKDEKKIKNKRRNLSSIKSLVNTDLRDLFDEGENLEGITIGPKNIFEMSDEAREKILASLTDQVKGEGPLNLEKISEILGMINDLLSESTLFEDLEDSDESDKLGKLKDLISGLLEKAGLEDLEVTEEEDFEEFEVDDDFEEEEFDDDLEEVEEEEALEDLDEEELEEELEDPDLLDEEAEDVEVEDDFEDADLDDDLEEVELEEEEEEEDFEEFEVDDDFEEEEFDEDLDEVEPENAEEYFNDLYDNENKIEKAKLLADEFDDSLADMDKFYNRYILIPEGEYVVGGKQATKDARLEHIVPLTPFYMGKFPVTNAIFEVFVEKTGYRTTAEKRGFGTVYFARCKKIVDEKEGVEKILWNSTLINKTVKGACWYQPFGPGSTLHNKRSHPLVQVSLEDAMAFAAWSGKRLPSEDEWEAASRGSLGSLYPWGNEWKGEACNTEETYVGDTTPVDKYIEFENDLGIADELGNVLEWTITRAESTHSSNDSRRYYIVKGGSWTTCNEINLTRSFQLDPESHSNILGFRCVAF